MPNQELDLNQVLDLGNEIFIPNLETPASVIPLLSLALVAVNVLERLPLKTRKTVLTCGVAGALTAILVLSGCQAQEEEISSTQLPERPALTVSVPPPIEQETPLVIFTPTDVLPEVIPTLPIVPTEPAPPEIPATETPEVTYIFNPQRAVQCYDENGNKIAGRTLQVRIEDVRIIGESGNFIQLEFFAADGKTKIQRWILGSDFEAFSIPIGGVSPTSEPAEPTQRPSTPMPGGETPIPSASPTPQGEQPTPAPASPTPGGVEPTPTPSVEPSPVPPTATPETQPGGGLPSPGEGLREIPFRPGGPELLRPIENQHWSIVGTEVCPGDPTFNRAVAYVETILSIDRANRTITVNTSAGPKTLRLHPGVLVYIGNGYVGHPDDVGWDGEGGVKAGALIAFLTQSSCRGETAIPANLESDPLVAVMF